MEITEIVDINGKEIKVGDKVAWGDTTSSYNSYICTGEVIGIYPKKINTEVIVKTIAHGGWKRYITGKQKKFIYPRYYNNLLVIN